MQAGSAFCEHEGSGVRIAGRGSGPLRGVTFAAKDLFAVAGHRCCCGNPDWLRTHDPATVTATAIELLVDGGATLVGKTTTDELAYSILGINHWYGAPPNPAAPDRISGGSSSGSASATAAGDVDVALGTDTAGSIRVPASWCGIAGIRPTHGAVPMDGVVPLAPSFDTCGWLARDTAMLERVGDVLLPDDSTPLPHRIVTIDELWALALGPVQRVVRRCLDTTVDAEPTSDPFFVGRDDTETFRVLQGIQVREQHAAWIQECAPAFGPDIGARLRSLDTLTIDDVAPHLARQQEIRDHLTRSTMEAVIAIPTTSGPAPHRSAPSDQIARVRPSILRLTCLASLAGLPQVTVPAGRVDGGPVGVSLIGPPGSDRALLRLARTIAPG